MVKRRRDPSSSSGSAPIDALVSWAQARGVELSGIQLKTLPGRGVGIVATRDLKEEETIIFVPVKAHRGLHSVPTAISRKLPPEMTIHGLLAAELALQKQKIPEWTALMPSLADFTSSLPFLWPEPLRALLPRPVAAITAKHDALFQCDWKLFSASFHGDKAPTRDDYLHAWCLVNTRSFYFETPDMLRYPWHDRLTLLPVADMFNHAASGCAVQFSAQGHCVITDRKYRAGEELCTSYGEHTNDYLFGEYGFIMQQNTWDKICLDDVIIPKLRPAQLETLKQENRHKDFTIGTTGVEPDGHLAYALRALCTPSADAQTKSRQAGPEKSQEKMLLGLLKELLEQSEDILTKISALKVGSEPQVKLLKSRWEQIQVSTTRAIKQFSGEKA